MNGNVGKRAYLGDGVYALFDGYHVILTTERGDGPMNKIFLDGTVIYALNAFVESLKPPKEEQPE